MAAILKQRNIWASARVRWIGVTALLLAAGCAPVAAPTAPLEGAFSTEVSPSTSAPSAAASATPTCSTNGAVAVTVTFPSADAGLVTVSGVPEGETAKVTWDGLTNQSGHFRIESVTNPAGADGVATYTEQALAENVANNGIKEWNIQAVASNGTACTSMAVPAQP